MQQESSLSTSAPYAILRIKRKRNEEPLDALVVESRVRRKKYRGGIDVFQFAQTVEDDAWKDERMKKVIENEISRLSREASKEEAKTLNGLTPDRPKSSTVRQKKEDNKRRYTILERDPGGSVNETRFRKPPIVVSSKDVAKSQSNFKLYDAIPSPEKAHPSVDSDIEKFLPMLKDYLSLQDISLNSSEPSKKEQEPTASSTIASKTTVRTDDYVWDIFYRRPVMIDEWIDKANVATLTGMSLFEEGLYDSGSDSEMEAEGDVDSNAEEYYKNDYPEEEELSDDGSDFEESFLTDEDDREESF
ncbi:hypothetical protein APHAL10511_008311 [Amanita phalloides]|nr:hypothetical protein APHAL10511_008311 [Amanita phalloides]